MPWKKVEYILSDKKKTKCGKVPYTHKQKAGEGIDTYKCIP